MESMEEVTGLTLVQRKLDSLAIKSLAREANKHGQLTELSKVKGDSPNDLAILAVVGFKPTRLTMSGVEQVVLYLYNLRDARVSAKLVAEKSAFFASVVKPSGGEVEGLLLLILRPVISIDQNTGTLTMTVTQQNQLSIVGRCKDFARCGAAKRTKTVTVTGETALCRLPVDSSLVCHCVYHSGYDDSGERVSITGSKRVLDALVGNGSTAGIVPVPMRPSQPSSAHITLDSSGEEDEPETVDKEDVAFSLRHHGAAVQNLLGAAYQDGQSGPGSGAERILHKADTAELLVAQRIIHTMASANTAGTSSCSGGAGRLSAGLVSTSTASQPLPQSLPQTKSQPQSTAVSALSRRAQLKEVARSANLHPSTSGTASYIPPPSAPTAPALAPNKYKLVGETLIDATNLNRNAPTVAISTAQSQPAPDRKAASFHQLLGLPAAPPPRKAHPGPGPPQRLNTALGTNVSTCTSSSTDKQAASRRPATATTATATTKASLDAEIEALLGKRSSHAAEAQDDWAEGFGKRMDVLAKREYAQTKAAEVHAIDISAFRCGQCENRLTEQFPTLCHEQKHPVQKVAAVKRFFECAQCGKRESSLSTRKDLGTKVVLPPEIRCLQCGAFRWRPCGQRGSGPLSVTARDALGGAAGPGATLGGGGNKLILSASEWSKTGDKVSMAERVSRL